MVAILEMGASGVVWVPLNWEGLYCLCGCLSYMISIMGTPAEGEKGKELGFGVIGLHLGLARS